MVKTGIPFMLNDRTGSLSGSEFVDLYDRIYLRVCCTHRDPNGASHYGMYNMLARHHEIPVVTFEYGAGGALGNITFISSEGSMRTQAMAAFLVEVGGYVNANNHLPLLSPLRSFCIKALMQCFCEPIDRATGNSPLLTGVNIAGVGVRAHNRISSGL